MLSINLDFGKYNLVFHSVLQHNYQSGRVTYLASYINEPNTKVIVKQFLFAKPDSSWSGFKSIQREIASLKNLNHPQISRYIDSFEDENGLCVLIEYLKGENLDKAKNTISPELAYDIILQILDILVYLQSQEPKIIHQDIKPQNILIDKNNKVYLVDFGLAREDNLNSLSISSTIGGTIGFISPEQIYKRKINLTTDVYALAITYFCLLLKINNQELIDLVNIRTGKIPLKPKLENITNPNIINWLLKATNSDINNRFADAKQARIELQSISPAVVKELTKIDLSKDYDLNNEFESNFFNVTEGILLSMFVAITTCLIIYATFKTVFPQDSVDKISEQLISEPIFYQLIKSFFLVFKSIFGIVSFFLMIKLAIDIINKENFNTLVDIKLLIISSSVLFFIRIFEKFMLG